MKQSAFKRPHPTPWTVIIPAAGRATRLQSSMPKILYPVLGKPIAYWIVAALRPYATRFVFVVSRDRFTQVDRLLRHLIPGRYRLAVQPTPKGMADAVWQSRTLVKTKNCVVIWGDQVNVSARTIAACVAQHEGREKAALTFPTVIRSRPYIQFMRNPNGRIMDVLQAREDGPLSQARGENDCGIFFFNRRALFTLLKTAKRRRLGIGTKTGEFNLLPLIPLWDRHVNDVVTVRIKDTRESQGINTIAEAQEAERVLKAARAKTS